MLIVLPRPQTWRGERKATAYIITPDGPVEIVGSLRAVCDELKKFDRYFGKLKVHSNRAPYQCVRHGVISSSGLYISRRPAARAKRYEHFSKGFVFETPSVGSMHFRRMPKVWLPEFDPIPTLTFLVVADFLEENGFPLVAKFLRSHVTELNRIRI
jgi:hypothetical protein